MLSWFLDGELAVQNPGVAVLSLCFHTQTVFNLSLLHICIRVFVWLGADIARSM